MGRVSSKILPVAEGHLAAATPRNLPVRFIRTGGAFRAPLAAGGQRQARTASAVRLPKREALRGGHVVRNVSFLDMTSGPSYAGHVDSDCSANCIHVSPPLMPFSLLL